MLKTWEELKSFDEILTKEEIKIIKQLRTSEKRCPHLKLDGEHYYYCGVGLSKEFKKDFIDPNNPIYICVIKMLLN